MFHNLPKQNENAVFRSGDNKRKFFDALPHDFKRAEAIELGNKYNLSTRSVDNLLKELTGKMKPDGTWRNDNEFYMDEKFGKVPVNWVIDRIKSFGEVVTGKTPPTDNQDNFSNSIGYMFITPGDIGEGIFINKAERYLSSSGIKYSYKIPANSVSFVSIGSTIGKVAITTEDSCSNQQINTIVLNEENNYLFLYYLLSFRANNIKSIAGTTATPQINKSDLSKIKVAKPATYDTQKMIGEKIFFVDNQKTLKYLKIQKLEKLKKSLMQKLLTGQVRVR